MEDFYYAGGLRAMLKVIAKFLKTGAKTVNGKSIGENIGNAEVYNHDVIRSLDNPIYPSGALVCSERKFGTGRVRYESIRNG